MKKIVIITNTAASLLNFRKELIKYLINEGHCVYGMAIDYSIETKKQVEGLGLIPVDYKLARGGLNPFADALHTFRLCKALKKLEPDIVLSTFAKPAIFGTIAARLAKVKRVIAMLEGLGYFFTEQPEGLSRKTKLIKWLQIFLYRRALPKADRIIFLNSDDPNDLLVDNSISVKDYQVLGAIGLSLVDFNYTEAVVEPVSFIFIGRLLKEKGVYEYLNAAKQVKTNHPDCIFYLLGSIDPENPGSLQSNVLNEYKDAGIIHYAGQVSDVKAWIRKSSVFVLPSYREGLPLSTQEAAAMGRAVITTDVPGCRETVTDSFNGFLVERWSAEKIAEKMEYFIAKPEEIIRMGSNNRKFAEQNYDSVKANAKLCRFIIED